MLHPHRRRRSRNAYGQADSNSARTQHPLSQNFEEEDQVLEQHNTSNDYDSRNHQPRSQHHRRSGRRDRQVQTDGSRYRLRAIEWVPADLNNADVSVPVAQNDGNKEADTDDEEASRKDSETDDHQQRDRQPPPQQLPRSDPPIAKFVRSQALRRSSEGRAFFSPSSLRNGEKAMTRNGKVEYPLLPISRQHGTSPLSPAACDFADIRSGDFRLCVEFLHRHERLLRDDYHPYLQEAWKALWDGDKSYAHQCLSRWFLLDKCWHMQPEDIGRYINRRTFSGPKFLDKVDDMYKTLKTLRQDVQRDMDEAANRAAGSASKATSTWSINGVLQYFQGVDQARVVRNVGNVYRLLAEVGREFRDRNQDLEIRPSR